MLQAQVNYWNLVETKRHNLVSEEELSRHNVATERQEYLNYRENVRHNSSVEYITDRHNRAVEVLEQRKINETFRHNLATERISYGQLEVARYNAETQRIGVNNQYSLGLQSNAIAARNANTNAFNAQTSRLNYQNSVRDTNIRQYSTEQSVAQGWSTLTDKRNQTQIRQSQLGLDTNKFKWSKGMDIWSNINSSVRTVGDIVGKAFSYANPLAALGGAK